MTTFPPCYRANVLGDMIRPRVQRSVKIASGYFREHLKVGDYYTEKANVRGEWVGQGAVRLGLGRGVSERAFQRLCSGNHPVTDAKLIARMNTTRMVYGDKRPNRRVGYDFVFSPTKSISVMAQCVDPRIVTEAHNEAVRVAMTELEKFVGTRVRRDDANSSRPTGNLVAALFQHDTSRGLDPHVHTHAFVMNATYDAVEERWKAIEPEEMFKAQRYVDAVYQHRLRAGLYRLGHACSVVGGRLEMSQVQPETIERFSKRHREIDELDKASGASGETVATRYARRERIARESRRMKARNVSLETLRESWWAEMTERERQALLFRSPKQDFMPNRRLSPKLIVDLAETHLFERNATVSERDLVAYGLLMDSGHFMIPERLWEEVRSRDYVRDECRPGVVSLKEQSSIEAELVELVDRSRGRCQPINVSYRPEGQSLDEEQARAVNQLLKSCDGASIFRGGAGTGKSFTLKHVVEGSRAAGRNVVVVAPQNQQVQELARDGLEAQTVERLLRTRDLPHNGVLIVDEAGQIGARRMIALVRLCLLKQARLILSGDTRQHGAVEATDALQLLETRGGVVPAELSRIRRQDPRRGETLNERRAIRSYRDAVRAAADGRIDESFQRLENEQAIHEVADESARAEQLADEFVLACNRKDRVLAIGQTWDEVNRLNQAIRTRLQAVGRVSGVTKIESLQNLNLTLGQRMDAGTYRHCRDIVFVRNYGRFSKGDHVKVSAVEGQKLRVLKDGKATMLSLSKADRFTVIRPRKLSVGSGDRLQLKFNGTSIEGQHLSNGELVTVERLERDGRLIVHDDRGVRKTLSAQQRVFNHGYAVTSYGSQGKTVDTVLFSDSGTAGATNRKQWYVTISRGRRSVRVFTSDARALREGIERSGDKDFALQEISTPIAPCKPPAAAMTQRKIQKSRDNFDAVAWSMDVARRHHRWKAMHNRISQQRAQGFGQRH